MKSFDTDTKTLFLIQCLFDKYQVPFLSFLSGPDLWENHISIKCHLVFIQTGDGRLGGCTVTWLTWAFGKNKPL